MACAFSVSIGRYDIVVSAEGVASWGSPVCIGGTFSQPPEVRYNALSPHGRHVATLAISTEPGGKVEAVLRSYTVGATLEDRHLTVYPDGRVEGGDMDFTAKPPPRFFGKLSKIFMY